MSTLNNPLDQIKKTLVAILTFIIPALILILGLLIIRHVLPDKVQTYSQPVYQK